jgi:hypothetical protein
MDEEQKQRFFQGIPVSEISEEYFGSIRVERVESWIDDEGHTRRTLLKYSMKANIGLGVLTLRDERINWKMNMRISDINKEILINLPRRSKYVQ